MPTASLEIEMIFLLPAAQLQGDLIGLEQRLVARIIMVTHGRDLGPDFLAGLIVASDKREGGIAAEHPAVIGIDHPMPRTMHGVEFDLVKSLQHEMSPWHQ